MKKILLLTILFLSTTLFAQDITNKLGSGGKFTITDNSNNEVAKVAENGAVTLKGSVAYAYRDKCNG